MGITSAPYIYDFAGTRELSSLAPLRKWVRARLTGLPRETVQDAELLATELVTNAFEHAGGPMALRLELPDDHTVIRLEVEDCAPNLLPTTATASPDSYRGRGLLLVDALSAGWGAATRDGRKTVWAEVPVAKGL
ncbi:ATP-binding protein [Amycolatopsis saalfeldensis]|uniref:Anti-sigma regulatory factor (Ser/Thr protein kinase) n=1 Tax=Amycolatopsis saalfeldensis TaxID=394193 RepID=A0A1H8PTG6_9PSEU|nr:ATP-binding protein [Amycolatopsis saalfeldensis]SEO44974.1 Anti-sigma regulatory factor (Ser/Thr protein kinase) [Amycolatopsis saalfeldensis]